MARSIDDINNRDGTAFTELLGSDNGSKFETARDGIGKSRAFGPTS